jgi:RHS repeat-associated protein
LIRDVQAEQHIGYTETQYTRNIDPPDQPDQYRLGLPCEVSTFELTGIEPHDHDYFSIEDLLRYRLSEIYQPHGIDVEGLAYHQLPDHATPQKRIVEKVRTLFFDQHLNHPLPLGELNPKGISYETYKLAISDGLLDAVLRDKLEELVEPGETYSATVHDILTRGGYHSWDGLWWIRSGRPGFAPDAEDHFFLPQQYVDPFSQTTRITYDPYDIYLLQICDPLENTTSVEDFDFRVLTPTLIKDLNDNLTATAFDILGMPTGLAVMGKTDHGSGDSLAEFEQDLSFSEVCAFFTDDDYSDSTAREWLGQATTRFVYYLGEKQEEDESITYGHHPACACKVAREIHTNQSTEDGPIPMQTAFEYSDGAGQLLVTKSPAEPEEEGGPMRWLATGKTIFNNKGKPVKQYEPYFSETSHRYEEPLEVGVTPVIYYDAAGRTIRVEQPDGTYSRVEFSPWFAAAYDANDTILEPDNAWYAQNSASEASAESQRAARLSSVHADTPAFTYLDSLGREVVAIAHNRRLDDTDTPVEESSTTYTKLDAEGKPLWIRDARGNRVMQYITPPIADTLPEDPVDGFTPCYDMAGNLLFQHSMDGGGRWMLNDAAGKPFYSWDSRANVFHTTYDMLRRPLTSQLRNETHTNWIVVGCTRYGDEQDSSPAREAEARNLNLKGQSYKSYDQSGLVKNIRFDFKGNPLEVHRRLAVEYIHDIHWDTAPTLEPDMEPEDLLMDETFQQISEYDALNRVTRQYNWHQGPESRVSVIEPVYNKRGKLGQEYAVLDAVKTMEGHEGDTRNAMVQLLTYDAKGQRQSITYGNGTHTTYTYDPDTFRLIHLETRKRDGSLLQDLHYTYDPNGNITEIVDNAQSEVIRNDIRVEPRSRYTYDALYRLIEARGREHDGQVLPNTPTRWHDTAFYSRRSHPHDDTAWRNYTEKYQYDVVGNILSMHHVAHGNTANNWHRHYQYALYSNRMMATGSTDEPFETYTDTPSLEYRYPCNDHGSITAMPHLETMAWGFAEHLHYVARTTGPGSEDGGGVDPSLSAWYRYDVSRRRTRKRVAKQGGIVEERLYLGYLEIFRKYNGDGRPVLEREALHIMDDRQRIAMVEIRTDRQGPDDQLIRFQLGNHLGSVSLELDADEQVISYEEYYPFGSTSYQAMNSELEVNPKRYRYTGMERDEETGLDYHTARYYVPWVGRWISTDPEGITDSLNLYTYCRNNPIQFVDPGGNIPIEHQLLPDRFPGEEIRLQIPERLSRSVPRPVICTEPRPTSRRQPAYRVEEISGETTGPQPMSVVAPGQQPPSQGVGGEISARAPVMVTHAGQTRRSIEISVQNSPPSAVGSDATHFIQFVTLSEVRGSTGNVIQSIPTNILPQTPFGDPIPYNPQNPVWRVDAHPDHIGTYDPIGQHVRTPSSLTMFDRPGGQSTRSFAVAYFRRNPSATSVTLVQQFQTYLMQEGRLVARINWQSTTTLERRYLTAMGRQTGVITSEVTEHNIQISGGIERINSGVFPRGLSPEADRAYQAHEQRRRQRASQPSP